MIKSIDTKKVAVHAGCILTLVIINLIYFFPQLQGKVLDQSDIISSNQEYQALSEYQKADNATYLWNPSQFGGMPVLAGAPNKNNLLIKGYSALRLFIAEPAGLWIAGSIMCYLLLVLLGLNPWLSVVFAIPMMYSTSNLMLWEVGHNSKIRTLIFTPLLIGGLYYTFEKRKYLLGFLLFALGFGFSFYTRHPQMTYYILLVFGVYGIVKLVDAIKTKEYVHLAKGVAVVLLATMLGLGSAASRTFSMYEYGKVTMRGGAILADTGSQNAGASSDGLTWDYAMNWSADVKDVMAAYIPGFVGGGNGQKVSTKSNTYKAYRIKQAPLYWGQLPFTAGPLYLGASVIFLFIFGLFAVKGNMKWWLGFGTLFLFLLSMGRYTAFLNRPLFDFLPFYSSFRAPQSVQNIASYFIPILGALAIHHLIKIKSKKKNTKSSKALQKKLYISYGIAGGVALLIAILGPSMFDFSSPGDARYVQQGADITPFIQDRKAMMTGDAWRTFFIVTALAGLIWAFLNDKISKYILIGGVGIIMMLDVMSIGRGYLGSDDFVSKSSLQQTTFNKRPVDEQILAAEKQRHMYRVHDMTIDTYNSSSTSAWHNTIGGYSPTKMQRYNDLIDRHIRPGNMGVLNMLNTKYLITPGEGGGAQVQSNPGALGTAWFVDNIIKVDSPNAEIDALTGLDTKTTAVVLDSEFDNYIGSWDPQFDPNGSISMTSYTPDRMVYTSNAASEQLAVFSEIWYPTGKGWNVYIDGVEVPHIRANYAVRAVKVPAGQHEVVFEFRPAVYYTGEKISLVASILILMSILGIVVYGYRGGDLFGESIKSV